MQSYHFLSMFQERRPKCMPSLPRIELVERKVMSIGFKIPLPSTLELMRTKKMWNESKKCLQAAAMQLMQMHDEDKIFQGGLSLESIAYSATTQEAFFLDWGKSCTPDAVSHRLTHNRRFYLLMDKTMDFE